MFYEVCGQETKKEIPGVRSWKASEKLRNIVGVQDTCLFFSIWPLSQVHKMEKKDT